MFQWYRSWHRLRQGDGSVVEATVEREAADDDRRKAEAASTLPRYEGTLEGVPHVHTHKSCGSATLIDESAIRTYLTSPLRVEDQIYCAGCRDHFHAGEFTWDATSESVLAYLGRLRREHLRRVYHLRLADKPAGVIVLPAAAKALKLRAKALKWTKYYLSLKILLDGTFAVELVDIRHRVTETVVDAAVPIIVERDQLSRMQGIVVDHFPGYGDYDLVITRLHG